MLLASGQGASMGRASGPLALSAEAASAFAASGDPPIFLRAEMDADDMAALRVSAGVVTTLGGITGDGAVAARVLGKPCIVGMSGIVIRRDPRVLVVAGAGGEIVVREGDVVAIVVEGARAELHVGA